MNTSIIIRHALELSVIFPSVFAALLPARLSFRFPPRKVWLIAFVSSFLFVLAGSILCDRFDWSSNMVLLPALPFFFSMLCMVSSLSISKNLFCFFTAAMLVGFCSMYTNYLMGPIELGNTGNTFLPVSGTVSLGLSLLTVAVFFRTLSVKLPYLLDNSLLDNLWKWLFFMPFSISVFNLWVTPISPAVVMTGRVRLITCVISLLIPFGSLLLFHLFWWVTVRLTESSRLQQENTLLKLEEKRFDEMQQYLDSSRALRHDMRQHLLAIQEYSRAGKYDKLMDYLKPLIDTVSSPRTQLCPNIAVDAISAHYDHLAREQAIDIIWQLELPERTPFHEADLCSIIGNLLENAIITVTALSPEERWIRVSAKMLSDAMLGLTVKNPYANKLRFDKNGLPQSSRSGHGVGLTSVSNIVTHYHGSMEIRTDHAVFSVGILLNSNT